MICFMVNIQNLHPEPSKQNLYIVTQTQQSANTNTKKPRRASDDRCTYSILVGTDAYLATATATAADAVFVLCPNKIEHSLGNPWMNQHCPDTCKALDRFHRHRVMHPPPTCLPPTCHRRRHIQRFHLPSSSSLVVHAVRSLLTYLQAASLLIYLLTCVLA